MTLDAGQMRFRESQYRFYFCWFETLHGFWNDFQTDSGEEASHFRQLAVFESGYLGLGYAHALRNYVLPDL